jgi:hypothetical protein
VLIISAGLLVIVLQLLMQGSWYIWWMGTGTYGARGFAGASLLLAYALLKSDVLNNRPLSNFTYVSMMILGGLSAFSLSLEETNIVNLSTFLDLIQNDIWYVIFAVIAGMQIVKMKLNLDRMTHLAYLLLALATVPGICNGIISSTGHIEIALITLVAALFFSNLYLWNTGPRKSAVVWRLFSGLIMIVFAVSIVLQTSLLRDFREETGASGHAAYTLDCREYVDSYREYQLIDGYEAEKNALHQFLVRQNCL